MTARRVSTSRIIVRPAHALEGGSLIDRHRARPILVFLARILDSRAQSREMIWPRPRRAHGRVGDGRRRARAAHRARASRMLISFWLGMAMHENGRSDRDGVMRCVTPPFELNSVLHKHIPTQPCQTISREKFSVVPTTTTSLRRRVSMAGLNPESQRLTCGPVAQRSRFRGAQLEVPCAHLLSTLVPKRKVMETTGTNLGRFRRSRRSSAQEKRAAHSDERLLGDLARRTAQGR